MFTLPPLPYPLDALDPVISSETLEVHHGRHHAGYVAKTNDLAARAGLSGLPLEEVVRQARAKGDASLFNNAAQAWNHGFFWVSMAAERTQPSGDLAAAVERDFGGLERLKDVFVAEGAGHFASGWVWLVVREGRLQVISTHDAEDTLSEPGVRPLLVCDLWEHAYYLDYKNARGEFLGWWFDELADWRFAATQLDAAVRGVDGYLYPPPEA